MLDNLEEEIKVKKLELASLKKKLKQSKQPNQWLDKTICACISPFVKVYNNSKSKLEDPESYLIEKLTHRTNKLHDILSNMQPGDKNIKKYLKKSVKLIIKLENSENGKVSDNKLKSLVNILALEIQRLRPTLTEEQVEKRNQIMQKFQKLAS